MERNPVGTTQTYRCWHTQRLILTNSLSDGDGYETRQEGGPRSRSKCHSRQNGQLIVVVKQIHTKHSHSTDVLTRPVLFGELATIRVFLTNDRWRNAWWPSGTGFLKLRTRFSDTVSLYQSNPMIGCSGLLVQFGNYPEIRSHSLEPIANCPNSKLIDARLVDWNACWCHPGEPNPDGQVVPGIVLPT